MIRLILVLFRILLLNITVAVVLSAGLFYLQVKTQQDAEFQLADERLQLAAHTARLLIEPADSTITPEYVREKVGYFANILDSRLSFYVSTDKGAPVFVSSNLGKVHTMIDYSEAARITPTTLEDSSGSFRVHSEYAGQLHVSVIHELPTLFETASGMTSTLVNTLIAVSCLLLVGGLIAGLSVMRMVRRYGTFLQQQIGNADRHPMAAGLPSFSLGWRIFMGPIFDIVQQMHDSRNQALSFASYASHELRSPLAIMRHQLDEGLAESVRAAQLRRIVTETYDNVLRLNRMIEDLLNLATMQAGTFHLNRVSVDINRFLREFCDEARVLAQPNKVKLVLKRGPKAEVMIDLQRFRQVLFNLLDNALKYSHDGGVIRIGCTPEVASVVLTFSDNGRGISSDALPHVFQPFFRESGSNGVRGSGLGLALVRWIVGLHGGSAAVASDPGHGTTFTIRIPRKIEIANV